MNKFKKEDIKGYLNIDGKKVTYLKEGVRTKELYPIQNPDTLEPHINQELINYEKYNYFYKVIMGLEDWRIDNN